MAVLRLIERGYTPRPIQEQFIGALESTYLHPHSVSFIHADTGIGKSLGLLSVSLDWVSRGYRVILATASHRLIRQLANIELPLLDQDLEAGVYYGLGRYPSKERIKHLLIVEVFDAETTAYLLSLANHLGPVDDFIDEHGPLPDCITESMVCCSHTEQNVEVKETRLRELNKPLIFTTHSAVIVDALFKTNVFGVNNKTILLVDEADSFIDSVEHARLQTLSPQSVMAFLAERCTGDYSAVKTVYSEMCQLCRLPRGDEHRELSRKFLESLKTLSAGRKRWQADFRDLFSEFLGYHPDVTLVASDKRQVPQLMIARTYANKIVGHYLTLAHHSVLVSGTLSIKNDTSGMNWAIAALRLQEQVGLLAQFSPDDFGTLTFTFAAAADSWPPIYVGDGELSARWVDRVAQEVCLGNRGSAVVLTGSHQESEQLEVALRKAGESRHIARQAAGQSIRIAAGEFLEEGGIFITAAGHTGLNLVQADGQLAFEHLFITRLGMAPKDNDKAHYTASLVSEFTPNVDVKAVASKHLSYEYSRNLIRAVRRMRQSIGRALRSADHNAHVTICDQRFPLYHQRDSKLSLLRDAIPARFLEAYKVASEKNSITRELLF